MSDYKSEDELKKEIVSFLEDKAEKGNILDLDEKRLKEEFSDDYYDKDKIGDLIDDLQDNDIIDKQRINPKILLPTKHEDELKKTLEDYLSVSPMKKLFLGLVLTMIFMEWQSFYNVIIAENFTATIENFRGVLIRAILASYILGAMAIYSYSKAKENIDVVKNHSRIITPALGLPTLTLAALLGIRTYYPGEITSIVIATIVASGLGAGAVIGVHFDGK